MTGSGQAMDILTMLGFVILVGVVVNNAILIVHQALNNFITTAWTTAKRFSNQPAAGCARST